MRRALWLVGLLLLAAACTREPGISPGDGNSDPAGASRNPVMSMERLRSWRSSFPMIFRRPLHTLRAQDDPRSGSGDRFYRRFVAGTFRRVCRGIRYQSRGHACRRSCPCECLPWLPFCRGGCRRDAGAYLCGQLRGRRGLRDPVGRPGNCPRYWGMPTAATSPTR